MKLYISVHISTISDSTLTLPNITSKIHSVAMFVSVNIQVLFYIIFVDVILILTPYSFMCLDLVLH